MLPLETMKAVTSLLSGRSLSTIEIEQELSRLHANCPDDLARSLNAMRRKGMIKGEVSQEKGGWVWWIE